jgi:hypothetical protein
MADSVNIRILPTASSIAPQDFLLIDNLDLGTQVIPFSSVILSAGQVAFYSQVVSLSNRVANLENTTTTMISGGISPSGSIIPSKVGILYFASNTKDYYLSIGTINNKDWKRILTVDY